ncbi:uncharacterized protein LOC117337873 [Pecten maximus]|uniref:uncharacterized protein LOC117337873 n=1 Tax=Pecten maximus TaxID=6579 RepID=UPI001458FD16|nr:uncharacterized protein LOC117337873 [Pecten maximus]
MWTSRALTFITIGVVFSVATSEVEQAPLDLLHTVNDLVTYVRDMENKLDDDLLDITHRVEELENLREMDAHNFSESILKLKNLHEIDEQSVRQLTSEITSVIAENKHLNADLNDWKHSLSEKPRSPDKLRIPPRSVSHEMTRSGSSPGTIAFYAILTRQLMDPGVHQKIIFDKIVTNVNAQISPYSGVFTCMQSGVHVFSWQTLLTDTHYVVTELVRNGANVGSEEIGNSGTPVSGSSTAVVDLSAMDEVWVRVAAHSVGADIQPHLTTLSGFRLP